MTPDIEEYEPDVLRIFQSKDETKAYYNKIAKFYDLLSEHAEQPMRRKGLEMLAARNGERILEIGFGTGHCLAELAQTVGPGGKVYGIDISEEMNELSRKLIQKMDLTARVEITCGDAEDLPLGDNALDGIFTSFTLELFDTPAIPRVLSECRRILKPGGRLVVVSLSKVGKGGLVMKVYEWSHRHFPNLMDCRPIYVRNALEAADFQIAGSLIEHMWVPVEIVSGVKKS
jgi:demethylmenaquinone methyltransferase/2-methoxy-6-polyprenyl-1,4-benzoquinol methylase